ncbi:winged helix-turn-helix domain-containing protein [Massilia sp. DWR3-1-1]|uniref:winged helix-turn-helix domain-containing protein n=1 Tax=Massilia sp. DWR3-1-1 TaxID=2804559 RepID=UPI003CF2C117
MVRCLVIEDEVDTSRYICNGLREAGYAPSAAFTGDAGLAQALGGRWELIIVDRMLPGAIDGLALIARLRELGHTTPIIVVSALSSTEERVRGLQGGADDYLPKPFAMAELLARIEAVWRRSGVGRHALQLQVADLTLDVSTMRVTRGDKAITLQLREFRLLEFLMRHESQVVTRTMLLEGVWDYQFDPQTNVIDVQISRLRTKVDRDFAQPLIHTVRGIGYRLAALAPAEADHAAASSAPA